MVPVKLTNVIVIDLSTSFAFITGAVAPIAEDPQTALPAAINKRKSSENPSFFPTRIQKIMVKIICSTMKLTPETPNCKITL